MDLYYHEETTVRAVLDLKRDTVCCQRMYSAIKTEMLVWNPDQRCLVLRYGSAALTHCPFCGQPMVYRQALVFSDPRALLKLSTDVLKELEGAGASSAVSVVDLKNKLITTLGGGAYGEPTEAASKCIQTLFREGIIYESKPGYVRRVGA